MSTLVLRGLLVLPVLGKATASPLSAPGASFLRRSHLPDPGEIQPHSHPALNSQLSQFQMYAAMRCNDGVAAALSPNARRHNSPYPRLSSLMQQHSAIPDKRPILAVCVTGKARTFAHVLAHETLKRHLIDSFGARETHLYFNLATQDSRGDQSQSSGGTLKVSPEDQVEATHYVADLPPPAYNGTLVGKRTRYVYPKAEIIIDDRADQQITDENIKVRKDVSTCKATLDESSAMGHSLVNQMVALKQCLDFVSQKEKQNSLEFGFIIKTRPDITYRDPVLPYCLHKHAAVADTTFHRHDWMYLIPRRHLASFGQLFNSWANCADVQSPIEHWIYRTLDSKITRKEEKSQQWLGAPMVLRPNNNRFPNNVCNEGSSYTLSAEPPYDFPTCIENTIGSALNALTSGEQIM